MERKGTTLGRDLISILKDLHSFEGVQQHLKMGQMLQTVEFCAGNSAKVAGKGSTPGQGRVRACF